MVFANEFKSGLSEKSTFVYAIKKIHIGAKKNCKNVLFFFSFIYCKNMHLAAECDHGGVQWRKSLKAKDKLCIVASEAKASTKTNIIHN